MELLCEFKLDLSQSPNNSVRKQYHFVIRYNSNNFRSISIVHKLDLFPKKI